MKQGSVILFFTAAVFAQTTLLNLVAIRGINANLLLCFTVLLTLISEQPLVTVGVAAISGFLYDICFSQYIGIYPVGLVLIGLLIVYIGGIINMANPKIILIVTIVATVVFNSVIWAGYALLGSPYEFSYVLTLQPFYALYNMVIVGVVYMVLLKVGEKDE